MVSVLKYCRFLKFPLNLGNFRPITISPALNLKEIRETKIGNELIIEGVEVPSPREPYLVKTETKEACPICALNLNVKHTDVLILSQYVRSDGCMLPRRITGLCKMQQKRIGTMVTMAQKAGLMSNLTPAYSKKDPKLRYKWKKCNTYFDESTIGVKKKPEPKKF